MLAGALSHGKSKAGDWYAIGGPIRDFLLIDEPVAGMTAQETERHRGIVDSLAGNAP